MNFGKQKDIYMGTPITQHIIELTKNLTNSNIDDVITQGKSINLEEQVIMLIRLIEYAITHDIIGDEIIIKFVRSFPDAQKELRRVNNPPLYYKSPFRIRRKDGDVV